MLLSILSRKEKLKFLDLAMHMVAVDGEPTNFEQRLLNVMLAEVGEGIIKEYTFSLSADLEDTIAFFEQAATPVKNIVYINLLKLIMLDDLYNTLEHFFLEDLRKRFEISDLKKKQLMQIIFEERDIKERAKRIVNF
jgi:hypothetical protein